MASNYKTYKKYQQEYQARYRKEHSEYFKNWYKKYGYVKVTRVKKNKVKESPRVKEDKSLKQQLFGGKILMEW